MILLIIIAVIFILYAGHMIFYWGAWKQLPEFFAEEKNSSTFFSVIIPARNEENNIASLLEKLDAQDYPKSHYEVIVVNDHSTDHTSEIVKRFATVKLVDLQTEETNSYKKKAIETGIAAAKNDFIVTTDADCNPSAAWLKTLDEFRAKTNAVFIAAPVMLEDRKNESGWLPIFQQLDFLVLQAVTAVAVNRNIFPMCNGANLGYEKNVFYEVDGFRTIDKLASGDDMLLMQKIDKRYPAQTVYLKSKPAIVTSQTEKNWKDFFNQRIRWASKARSYNNRNIFFLEILVYLVNLAFPILLVASFFNVYYLYSFLILLLLKTIVEFPLVYVAAGFFGKRNLLKWFPIMQPLHIIYTVVIGFLAQFVSYEWKGRRVK